MESATQEIDETIYWLELLAEASICEEDLVQPVMNEAIELIRIFTAIVRKRKGL